MALPIISKSAEVISRNEPCEGIAYKIDVDRLKRAKSEQKQTGNALKKKLKIKNSVRHSFREIDTKVQRCSRGSMPLDPT